MEFPLYVSHAKAMPSSCGMFMQRPVTSTETRRETEKLRKASLGTLLRAFNKHNEMMSFGFWPLGKNDARVMSYESANLICRALVLPVRNKTMPWFEAP